VTLPRFDYVVASSVEDAFAHAGPGAVFLGGGTDLLPAMKQRLLEPSRVVAISRIPELLGIGPLPDGTLRVGAAVTLTQLADWAAGDAAWADLAAAIRQTSSPLLRNAGTVGGNLCLDTRCVFFNQPAIFRERWGPCLKMGGAVCHAVKRSTSCHAVYSGDLAGPLVACGASVTIAGPEGRKTVPLADLFTGDALAPIALRADQMVVDVRIPATVGPFRLSYQKSRLRDSIDFPLVGVSIHATFDADPDEGRIRDARVVLNAAGPAPLLVPEAAALLEGLRVDADLEEEMAPGIGAALVDRATFAGNAATSAAYRRRMIPVLARRALRAVLARSE
jgi:4-hydroxybenzoyl-CoA reductase subunit beta